MKKILFLLLAVSVLSCAKKSDPVLMLVGTYTNTGSQGIYSYSFDQENGVYRLLDSIKAVNPSFLVFSADSSKIYSVNEIDDSIGAVSAFVFDKSTGAFSEINSVPTTAGAPCYIATNGKIVVTANYGGGSLTVFPLTDDGSLLPLDTLYAGAIGGPDSTRQEAPHVHCVEFSPDGNYLFASDFSADRILCFEVTDAGKKIIPLLGEDGEQVTVPVQSDYGPRHILFDHSGKHAYVIGELSGLITVFDYDNGTLTEKQVVDIDPYDGRGSADIHFSPDGRLLYASNRLRGDGISVSKVDETTGTLSASGYILTGRHPRHFNITPNGKFLLVACRDINEIQVFTLDPSNGLPERTDETISVPAPVCVQFLK